MSRVRYFLPMLLAVLVMTVSAAPVKNPDPPPSSRITVGEFALKVIKLSSDNPSKYSSLTAEEAVKMLKQAGLNLKGSVNDPLTKEGKSDFAFAVANGLLEKLNSPPPGFEACMALTSVPECRACCLSLPGADHQACGQSCGRNHADQQHASASEPTP
ncbi:MAG TPA: hypothetical protein VFW45_06710 [Candidatus Polarisedimenticolia bacterium]|nr:hypothetical protein [Candidatus Polarisedimenticolia bacterium]